MAARRTCPATRGGLACRRVDACARTIRRLRPMTPFAQALGRFGWFEGKNIRIDYRFAAGDPTLYKSYATELVGLSPAYF